MERIDLLWDAWEDCLCKAELRAEFDRLNKMALDEWERAEALQSWLDTIEKSRRAFIKILDETMLENEVLQSWLDRISEPVREWLSTIPPVSKSWDEHKMGYAFKSVGAIQEYLDSQKKPRPADSHKKPNHVHSDDGGIFWEGQEGDCPICSPKSKPLTQCPECIWGQKRREFTAVEGAYCKYVVYERCPRCKGEGRISC